MFVSIAAYALLWGLPFAAGFVLLLFVHEMGHALEARRQGLNVSAPIFIPFLGAAILLKEQPQDVWREFKIAAAGPILGSVGALAVLGIYGADGPRLLARARVHRLLPQPVQPRAGLAARRGSDDLGDPPRLWIPGLAGLAVLLWFFPSPILIIVVFLGALQACGLVAATGARRRTSGTSRSRAGSARSPA